MVSIYVVNSRTGGALAAAVVRVHEQCVVINPSVRDCVCMFIVKVLFERTQIRSHARVSKVSRVSRVFNSGGTPRHTHAPHTRLLLVVVVL